MERLDKVISNYTEYSRSDVKKLLRNKKVKVNGEVIRDYDYKVDKETDEILVDDIKLEVIDNIYIALNKPEGYISATEDRDCKTVLDLIKENVIRSKIFPVGRLDKDTTGLIILTSDGKFSHDIVSPKKHVDKVYDATLDVPVTDKMIKEFEKGVMLGDEKCLPAKLEILSSNVGRVTLREGKYHQVKRMFEAFEAKVVKLNRIQIGNYALPEDLKLGEYKFLNEDDILKLKGEE